MSYSWKRLDHDAHEIKLISKLIGVGQVILIIGTPIAIAGFATLVLLWVLP